MGTHLAIHVIVISKH